MRLSDGDKYIFDFQVIQPLLCFPLLRKSACLIFGSYIHRCVAKVYRRVLVEVHHFLDQTAHHNFRYIIGVNLRERHIRVVSVLQTYNIDNLRLVETSYNFVLLDNERNCFNNKSELTH